MPSTEHFRFTLSQSMDRYSPAVRYGLTQLECYHSLFRYNTHQLIISIVLTHSKNIELAGANFREPCNSPESIRLASNIQPSTMQKTWPSWRRPSAKAVRNSTRQPIAAITAHPSIIHISILYFDTF